MTIEQLEKELKNGQLNSIYLFYGEETYLLENAVKKIKNLFGESIKGINYILIDDTNVSEIISDIETPAFGYEKKLIIIKNAGLFKKEGKRKTAGNTAEIANQLAEYIKVNKKQIEETIILVMVEETVDKNELYKIVEKEGQICCFELQKLPNLIARMKAICHAYQVGIEDDTLRYFIECCGTNMQDLINEIRKLIEFTGAGGKIQKQDIDLLTTKQMESVIFDLTDNLGKKNIAMALLVLKNLIDAKEPIQKILITLYNHFKKIYIVKRAMKVNRPITECLNLKPNQAFLANKYKTQSTYFKEEELRKILQELIDLDYHYKSGKIDLMIGLESILCHYCS